MQGNLFNLIVTLLTIMAAILLASQKLSWEDFTITIKYQSGRGQQEQPATKMAPSPAPEPGQTTIVSKTRKSAPDS